MRKMETMSINVNGIEYIKKGESKKEAKRFKLSDIIKLLRLFNKKFDYQEKGMSEEYAVENGIQITDPACVMCVTAKSEEAKRFLAYFRNLEIEDDSKKIDKLDFKADQEIKAKYSMEYLQPIFEILNVTGDGVKIQMKTDYPIKLENEHFEFVLAPRVEDDE